MICQRDHYPAAVWCSDVSFFHVDYPFCHAIQRTAVFQWIGAIALDLGCDELPLVAYQLLAPLSRELVRSDASDSGKQLCQLAKQVSDSIKKKLGMELYMQHITRLQIGLATRRADRKKHQAQQVSM
jgi:U3 small nucleolar RNA-associated protein 20